MDLIVKARNRRSALLAEVADLDIFIKMAEKLSDEPQDIVAFPENGALVIDGANLAPPDAITKKARVERASVEIIREHGPMKKPDLLARLLERGVDPGTADPSQMLATILNRSKLLEYDRELGVWQLAK